MSIEASAKACRDRLRETLAACNEAIDQRERAKTPEAWHFWDETVRGCTWQMVQLRLKLFQMGEQPEL